MPPATAPAYRLITAPEAAADVPPREGAGAAPGRSSPRPAPEAAAEAEVYKQTALQEGNWDKIMAQGSQQSLKDEWLTILFSIPLILAFIPGAEGIVQNGFEQLETMPTWYQYSLGVIVAASFGVRSATKFFGKR